MIFPTLRKGATGRMLVATASLLWLHPLGAVERQLRIEAPATASAGREVGVVLQASTDAGQGEQVGFLQAEMSADGGRTWVALCYLQNCGAHVEQRVTLPASPAGTTLRLRVRAAFRGGLAGDVDFSGAAIRWHDSWDEWRDPPAKQVSIPVASAGG